LPIWGAHCKKTLRTQGAFRVSMGSTQYGVISLRHGPVIGPFVMIRCLSAHCETVSFSLRLKMRRSPGVKTKVSGGGAMFRAVAVVMMSFSFLFQDTLLLFYIMRQYLIHLNHSDAY